MTSRNPIFRTAGRRAVEILLWCGAALGTLSILAAVAAVSFSIVPLVFTSGSMSPEIATGSLGLARTVPAGELRVGDVVSVTASNDTRVTHRIVATDDQSDTVLLTLQGDTNPAPDQESYPVTEADRVFFTVPHLGRVVVLLTSPWAMFVGGLAAATLLFWAFRRQPPTAGGTGSASEGGAHQAGAPPEESGSHRADHSKPRRNATLVALGIPALLVISANSGTAAVFTDTAQVNTTGFGTHRLLQPGEPTCAVNGTTITVSTTPLPDQRYTYWARAYDDTGLAVSGYKQMTDTPATAGFSTTDFPTLDPLATYTFRIHSRIGPPGPSGWESALFRRARFSRTGTTLACGDAIVPPVITFTQPINSFNGDEAALLALVNTACAGHGSANPGICGTATDQDGVASVQYILRRTRPGLGTYCWDGTRYPATGSCRYRDVAQNGDKWSIPGDLYTGLLYWNYTLTIKAIDDFEAVSEKSISFRVNP